MAERTGRRSGGRTSGGRPLPSDPHTLPADPHKLPARGEWFAPDAERHLLDRPRFCPMCGESLEGGLTCESWSGDERIFLTWCARCSWTGNVVRIEHIAIYEPEH